MRMLPLLVSGWLFLSASAAAAGPFEVRAQPPGAGPSGACSGWSCPYARTQTLLQVSLASAAVHMVDNALSYRTFTAETIPSTLVQLTYVGGAVAYWLEAGPAFWIVYATAMLTAHSLGHLFVPTATNYLPTFYDRWTTGPNRLGVSSPAVGRLSQATLIVLDLSMAAVLLSSIQDGFRHGHWLTRAPR